MKPGRGGETQVGSGRMSSSPGHRGGELGLCPAWGRACAPMEFTVTGGWRGGGVELEYKGVVGSGRDWGGREAAWGTCQKRV